MKGCVVNGDIAIISGDNNLAIFDGLVQELDFLRGGLVVDEMLKCSE